MPKTYHFIGIKGSGMSALALMLHQMGHKVQDQMLKSTTLLNVVLSRQELLFFLLMKRT